MDKLRNDETTALFSAILTLKNIDECYDFFEDLCTAAELVAMSQRLAVAKMLAAKHNYQEISKETGASTATISRVAKCLSYGKDGYSLVLDRLSASDR